MSEDINIEYVINHLVDIIEKLTVRVIKLEKHIGIYEEKEVYILPDRTNIRSDIINELKELFKKRKEVDMNDGN